ncbi:hypothetical protein FFLO_00727 [Filobasidium floriforme]|uniref:MADS-box domain-containing protein n=1 Tax=Filobasidium floriforme TaxID=5210 RepID=A0A8K0NQP9_9TREE|nr:hypothetical protein FFLO_00727 [Filobasidium floriforme]
MGRKKIIIKRLTEDRNRNVTFLKASRKHGLLKKAWELSVLCGAEVSILIFSHNGKCYEFSSSDLDSSIDRYHAVRPHTLASFVSTYLRLVYHARSLPAHTFSRILCASTVLGSDRASQSSRICRHGRERRERRRLRFGRGRARRQSGRWGGLDRAERDELEGKGRVEGRQSAWKRWWWSGKRDGSRPSRCAKAGRRCR